MTSAIKVENRAFFTTKASMSVDVEAGDMIRMKTKGSSVEGMVMFETTGTKLLLIEAYDNGGGSVAVYMEADIWKEGIYICDYQIFDYECLEWLHYFERAMDDATYNTNGVLTEYEGALFDLCETYEPYQVEDRSTPSAPNTSTFRAAVSGKLTQEKSLTSHGGQYELTVSFSHCVKIGQGIKGDVVNRIKAQALMLTYLAAAQVEHFTTYQRSGTNFDTIGLGCVAR
jgi:hypothetical protein